MRCVLLPFLLLTLAAASPATVASADGVAVLAPDAEERWVPFELTAANHLRFRMTVDGAPATAVLDTGLSHSAMSRDFARKAGLSSVGSGQATAIGGDISIEWVAPRSLSFGGLSRAGGRVLMLELPALLAAASTPADMLIGADLLSGHALDIDFAQRRFRLLPSGRMPFAGARVPLRLQPASGVYLTEAMLGRRRVRPLLVDTGDGSALTVTDPTWKAAGVRNGGVTSTIAYGVGGQVQAGLAITDAVRLGSVAPGAVEVRIEDAASFAQRSATVGRIGTGLLRRYRVLLDPRAGHMLLAPIATAAAEPVRSTSGLLLGYDRKRLRVLHVMRGSPAARTGWKTDDLICTVDGQPVRLESGAIDANWTIDRPGRSVALEMCDGTARTLTLANFY